MVKRIGLIGFGAIGRSIAAHLKEFGSQEALLVSVCVRPARMAEARALLPPNVAVTQHLDELLASKMNLVIEAAGQEAVAEYAERVLQAGPEFLILSIGALADPTLRTRLREAAARYGGAVSIPAGALAGFDGLRAMQLAGLTEVTYTSTKPPNAWLGTPAEDVFELDNLAEHTVIFTGSASEAALKYPKNANLAAAVALAGIGFDDTRVELVADPKAVDNTGRVVAVSPSARLELIMSSRAFDHNPKTSEITAFSVIAAIENQNAAIRFV